MAVNCQCSYPVFPSALSDFACLQPNHMEELHSQVRVHRLAEPRERYSQVDTEHVVTQWRLCRHILNGLATKSLTETYKHIPADYGKR